MAGLNAWTGKVTYLDDYIIGRSKVVADVRADAKTPAGEEDLRRARQWVDPSRTPTSLQALKACQHLLRAKFWHFAPIEAGHSLLLAHIPSGPTGPFCVPSACKLESSRGNLFHPLRGQAFLCGY